MGSSRCLTRCGPIPALPYDIPATPIFSWHGKSDGPASCWSRKCSLKCAVHTDLGTPGILSRFPWKNFITLTPPGLCWPQPYREAAVLPTGQILGIQGMEGHRGCNWDTPLWPGMPGICSGPALGIREPPGNPQAPTAHARTPQLWPWILLSLLNSPCPSPWLWRESRNAGGKPGHKQTAGLDYPSWL